MIIKNPFWLSTLIFFLAGLIILLIFPGVHATVWANEHHSYFLDIFFSWDTKIAEWPVVVVALGWAFYTDIKTGILAAAFYGLEALIVNQIKIGLGATRPRVELGISNMHTIIGTDIHSYHSFPSGHTTAAFMGFGFIALLTKNKYLQVFCSIMAALIGYSRLYLGQHYLRDVLAGIVIALVVLYLFTKALPKFQSLQLRKK